MGSIATPGCTVQSLTDRAVTRFLAWLDGHGEVSVRGPVPCDVRPDRRSWLYTTRSGLWPEEVTGGCRRCRVKHGMVPPRGLRSFTAWVGAGRGGRRAGTCRR